MKKIVFLLVMAFFQRDSIGQVVDTSFVFYPVLTKDLKKIVQLDSIGLKNYSVLFERDTIDSRYLNISIKGLNGNLIEEGRYRLDTTRIIYNRVFNRSGDMVEKRIRGIEYRFLREGYWRNYRRNRISEIYYSKGNKLKMKVK